MKKKTVPTSQFDIFWETKENPSKWKSVPLTEWDDSDGRWAMLVGHLGLDNWIGSPCSITLPGWNDADL
jgi:hypothetical protein